MDKAITKEIIKIKAVELFSKKGYHGTTIRDIATAAGCSLPMLYYYYKNKEELFHEVAYKEFIVLIERMNASVKQGNTIQDTYINAVRQRKLLNEYDKAVYKLSLRVWLGFGGSTKAKDDLVEWEKNRLLRTREILSKHCKKPEALPLISSILMRVMENMFERIILQDEDIPDEVIRDEINYLIQEII